MSISRLPQSALELSPALISWEHQMPWFSKCLACVKILLVESVRNPLYTDLVTEGYVASLMLHFPGPWQLQAWLDPGALQMSSGSCPSGLLSSVTGPPPLSGKMTLGSPGLNSWLLATLVKTELLFHQ